MHTPSHTVEQRLCTGFARCTFVRNHCLDNNAFRDSLLPELKKQHPELKEAQSHVLQKVIHRIVSSLRALRAMKAKGRKVGKLRKKWVHSMEFDSTGFKLTGNRLRLSKIGELPIELSRPVPGRIKQIVIKHTPAHKWFVAIISETPDTPEPTTGTRAVGIDLNLENSSTDTDGVVFEHPHNVRKSAKRLRRAQRKLSRAVKGSRNRRKQRVTVARIHERIENRRDDFLHTWSRYYVDRYHLIALEHLNIRPMVESLDAKLRGRSKSILDAAMGRRAGAGEAGGFESRGTRQESSYATKLRMLVSMSTLLIRPTRPRTVSSAGTGRRKTSGSEPMPVRSTATRFPGI